MAITVDAGSPLLIEVEFTKAAPFSGYTFTDPTSTAYTVIFSSTNTVKDTGVLLSHDTGRWYCILQTDTDWDAGEYIVRVSSTYDTSSDVEVKEIAFILSTDYVV